MNPIRPTLPRVMSAMRARPLALAIAAAALLASGPVVAGIDRAGTTAADFLSVGSGAGFIGMGGAGLALEGGLAASTWNPASLVRIPAAQIVFSHAALGEQSAQEWAGFAGDLRFGGLKGAVTGLFQSEGTFEGRDAFNNPTSPFDASSLALGLDVARAFGEHVTAGVGMKYASENLAGVHGGGVTFDAGVQVQSGPIGFGAAAQNAFGQMKYGDAIYPFPSSYGLGVSYRHAGSGVRAAIDLNIPVAYYTDLRGGVEWRMNERMALRTGYRAELGAASGEPLSGPTFGMGLSAGGMWLDYGYLVGGGGSGQHRISLTLQPGALTGSDGGDRGYASAPTMPAPKDEAPARTTRREPVPANPPAKAEEPARSTVPAAAPATTMPAKTGAQAAAPAISTTVTPTTPSAPSAPAPTSAKTGAPAVAKDASGPVATNLSTAEPVARPTYVQRAKAARGTATASAASRQAAAAEPLVKPRPPIPAEPAPKRDSTAAKPAANATPAPSAANAAPTPSAAPASAPQTSVVPVATAQAEPAAKPKPARPRPAKVRVKGGQSLGDVAKEYGVSVAAIMMENNMTTENVRSGQVLKLPKP